MSWVQLASLVALGAFHGLNPAMGWLFAVGRAMQERSRGVLLKSHMAQMTPAARMDGTPAAALGGLAAAGVHTLAMFTVMAVCALIVYEFVGVNILRHAWFNLDRLWAGVMVAAGALTIAFTA